ncbi:HAD family hydrolase [Streptomyces sp. NPDC046805]|uniref:HAD family hydrolase n=1 Tax=Streptomyces sp. NPDC046805 TaxID=3155134 RepID=UPI0033FA96C4
MTSDTTQTEPPAAEPGRQPANEVENTRLRELITRARVVLWDFDGPICRLFAGHSAERVANGLTRWIEEQGGPNGLLTQAERESTDPHVVLRAVDRRHPGSDLVVELEERLTAEELRAAASAMPTAYADPLIRTWTALGARMAVTTDNSPRVVHAYLESRGLTTCFAPHIYGRTQDIHHLGSDPHCLHRALDALGAPPSDALLIGDAPTDFEAAREAGVPFLGYARNDRKAEILREAGAEDVVESLESVLSMLRR